VSGRLSLDEHQLIENAQRGDVEAFSSLTARFERRIFVLALHYTRDQHDAEDLVQDVWLKAFRSLNSFRGDASFYTWLRHIMINTFLNHRRSESSRSRIPGNVTFDESELIANEAFAVPLRDRTNEVEHEYERKVLVECVMQALEKLTAQQRLIFLLKHREGMTYSEISLALGCSIGTVKKSLARVVSKMRGQFGVSDVPLEYAHCGEGRTN
jgi:RNA polymerase sigma-70 factor, ECF subfamily